MLFSSVEFLTWFLPLTAAGFFVIARLGLHRPAIFWLILCSIFFYGWYRIDYVPLLLGSIAFNFFLGRSLAENRSRALLVLAVSANLLALGYFKYTGMLMETVDAVFGGGYSAPKILLPLGISFWTFQQIAFLVDSYNGVTKERDFTNYCLFVSFFPQLIAGPIVHHKEMLPQFQRPETFVPRLENLALGLASFGIGLFKKVVIADGIGNYADTVFDGAAAGASFGMLEAWAGATFFMLQIYFDFSGYTDMAIGIGLIFGIRLPLNFVSPFKASNIIDFWRRWHVSLTRFLTGYIYNPIVMSLTEKRMARGAPLFRQAKPMLGPFLILLAFPTIVTMGLAGIWHGAGWQFVVFGLLHGFYLVVNHGWRALRNALGMRRSLLGIFSHPVNVLVTFAAVVLAIAFFRAESIAHAMVLVEPMFALDGLVLPQRLEPYLGFLAQMSLIEVSFVQLTALRPGNFLWLPILFFVVWALPNTQEWIDSSLRTARPISRHNLFGRAVAALRPGILDGWRPSPAHGFVVGVVLFTAVGAALTAPPNEFIYFDF